MKLLGLTAISLVWMCQFIIAQPKSTSAKQKIVPAADKISNYIGYLKNKRVGIFANQTSRVGNSHLVDTLRSLGIQINAIFGPEHGFRGNADAGEKVGNYTDPQTGIPVISLYGAKRKPNADDLKNIDILLFDIQDVGVRFYTYISSLEELMESALENNKPLLILDRPNPNGHYVDGPVLQTKYKSFIGRQPVPIVYGMTIGEYAQMLAGEKWLSPTANEKYALSVQQAMKDKTTFVIKVIPCEGYTHTSKYELPIKPSPNLPNIQSIYLYPSTCLFEGTQLSEGRGTDKPFQVFGHPSLPKNLYSFTPNPNDGAKNSKHYGSVCYGWDVSGSVPDVLSKTGQQIQLKWILEAFKLFPDKENFFIKPKSGKMEESFITKLSGNNELWQQIQEGKSEADIRATWEPALSDFKKIRKKYLLYKDF